MSDELLLQTQDVASSGAEVDELTITRSVLSERRSHEKAVGRRLKGFKGSSSSTAASRDLELHPPVPLTRSLLMFKHSALL